MAMQLVIHKNIELGVINKDVLTKNILEQGPQDEPGRLLRQDGIVFEEVKKIRLEFLNILKIDHLWMMTSLTVLKLCNNVIEKIENIEMLVNLVELDFSFNYIKKIENIGTLVNIEILLLYNNLLTRVENLSALKKLTILNLGNNDIDGWDENILYLRKFHNLQSLNLAGNSCSQKENWRFYLACFLPQVKYYEYKMFRPEEREEGKRIFNLKLLKLEEKEEEQKEIDDKIAKEIADIEFYSISYVENLNGNQFSESLFVHDPEGCAFLKMGDDVMEIYHTYKQTLFSITQQIFHLGQKQHHIREEESRQFKTCLKAARKQNQEECNNAMENFINERDRIIKGLKDIVKIVQEEGEQILIEYTAKVQELNDDFSEISDLTWSKLMEIEQVLYEGTEESNGIYERNMEEHVNVFIEAAQGLFVQARDAEVNYSNQVNELAMTYFQALEAKGGDDPSMSDDLRAIMSDKDAIINAIAGSHDVHMQTIDAREDVLISRIRMWHREKVNKLKEDEIARDRAKILEINTFLDLQREEFEEILTPLQIQELLPLTDTGSGEGVEEEEEIEDDDHHEHEH